MFRYCCYLQVSNNHKLFKYCFNPIIMASRSLNDKTNTFTIHNISDTVKFFAENNKKYTTNELKEVDMLHSALNAMNRGYVNCEITYKQLTDNTRERIKSYVLTDAGKELYKNN